MWTVSQKLYVVLKSEKKHFYLAIPFCFNENTKRLAAHEIERVIMYSQISASVNKYARTHKQVRKNIYITLHIIAHRRRKITRNHLNGGKGSH